MAVLHTVNSSNTIVVVMYGKVRAVDIIRTKTGIHLDNRVTQGYKMCVIEKPGAIFLGIGQEVLELAAKIDTLCEKVRGSKTAYVVLTDKAKNLAKRYRGLTADRNYENRIFEDQPSAMQWLRERTSVGISCQRSTHKKHCRTIG